MELKRLEHDFTVCKIKDLSEVDVSDEFYFIGKTDEELSLVCLTEHTPKNTIAREDGWRAFRLCGTFDFSLIGILSRLSSILAENHIAIFAVSTYHTDYILVKKENYPLALAVLEKSGYRII